MMLKPRHVHQGYDGYAIPLRSYYPYVIISEKVAPTVLLISIHVSVNLSICSSMVPLIALF